MNRLPQEIVHHILEFAGKVKYRNGKYMYQISNDDERYTMLLKMPKIMPNVIQGWSIAITPIQSSSGKKKSIYYNKYVCSYSEVEPYITVRTNGISDYYNFSQQGYCYNISVYHTRKN